MCAPSAATGSTRLTEAAVLARIRRVRKAGTVSDTTRLGDELLSAQQNTAHNSHGRLVGGGPEASPTAMSKFGEERQRESSIHRTVSLL